MPSKIALAIAAVILVIQVVGELLEFKGKVVPEFMKIRKYFARKKREREILRQVPDTLNRVQLSLDEFNKHYSSDNIRLRDEWIENVNKKLEENDSYIRSLDKKLDRNNQDTLSLLIDSKRNAIINFASYVADEAKPVTREQFNRIFKLYQEYEDIISENGFTNGEVDIAYRIIKESYEAHTMNHTFIEDARGYN